MFKLVIIEISNPNEILFHTHQMGRAGKQMLDKTARPATCRACTLV